MKVLLVSANTETSPYPVYPLGIDYVAGLIGGRHRVFIADMNQDGETGTLGSRIRAIAPDVVGFSIRNIDNTDVKTPRTYLDHYKSLVGEIRRETSAPVVLGGSGFTLFPEELLDALQADYGIVGEGERFGHFLDAYEKKADVSGLEGVIRPGASSPEGPSAPRPWDGGISRRFDPESPHVNYYLKRGGMLNLQTKRGCPFHCIYCTYPLIEGKRLRLEHPSAVAETARGLQAAGAKYLFITDSVFNSDYDHSLEVARAFRKSGVSIPWGAYVAPTRPPPCYFRELAKAGMTHVEFGTEAISDTILENYRKPFRAVDVHHAHKAAIDAGLNAAHFFLSGAPAETPQTLAETLENAELLEKSACFFFTGIRVYPGTRLHEIALASGQVTAGTNLLTPYFFRPEGISLEKIGETLQERSRNRVNWIFGGGGEEMTAIVSRLHARGHAGPLWEHLVR